MPSSRGIFLTQARIEPMSLVRPALVGGFFTSSATWRAQIKSKWKWKLLSLSDSLGPQGLYSPWNYPGQSIGVGSHSILQGIFPTQGSNPGLLRCRRSLYQLSHKGSPRILEWVAYPFSMESPNPGIEPGSPALQADPLPTEPPGKPCSSSLLQGVFPTRGLNPGLLHWSRILYQLSY